MVKAVGERPQIGRDGRLGPSRGLRERHCEAAGVGSGVMAAIDSLLKLVAAQKADAMIVASERVPLLKKGGADVALSMPKVSHDMVAIFLEDLVDAEQLQAIKQGGTLRIAHSVGDQQFSAELNGEGGRFRLAFYLQRPGGPPSPARRGTGAPSGRDVTEPHRAGRELGLPVPPPVPAPPRPVVVSEAPRPVLSDRPQAIESASPIAYRTASENAGDLIELALQAHRDGASDLLLSTGMPARLRLGGALRETGLTCDAGQILALAELAMTPERRRSEERR